MKQNKTYLHLGVTLVVSACAVLMFYDTFFQSRVLLDFFDKLECWGCFSTAQAQSVEKTIFRRKRKMAF